MKILILKNEDYLELTSELTAMIVHERHGDKGLIEEEDGSTRYTEEAQADFNDLLLDVEEKLRIARIYEENDPVVLAKQEKTEEPEETDDSGINVRLGVSDVVMSKKEHDKLNTSYVTIGNGHDAELYLIGYENEDGEECDEDGNVL